MYRWIAAMIAAASFFCASVNPRFWTMESVSLEKQSVNALTSLVASSRSKPDKLQ